MAKTPHAPAAASTLSSSNLVDAEDTRRDHEEGGVDDVEVVSVRPSGLRPPTYDPMIGRCLGGKLIVGERLGSSGLGVVYRAKHVLLPQPVAVKVLHMHWQADFELRARFLREARAASTLDHPSLTRVVDFGEERSTSPNAPGLMWLATELIEGRSLDALLAEQDDGRLPVERAIQILVDICAGLAHAHSRGIIHGDVTSSNIIVVSHMNDDGEISERAKLRDSGVVAARVDQKSARREGSDGRELGGRHHHHDTRELADPMESGLRPALGSPAYMSPEQCLGEELDARSDVYSCGVLFYELLTGDAPFAGDEPQPIAAQKGGRQQLPVTRERELDARVDAIVSKALSREREDRFASMRELRAALLDLAGGLGLRTASRSTLPPPAPPSPSSPAPSACLSVSGESPEIAPPPPWCDDPTRRDEQSLAAGSEEITPIRTQIVSEVRALCREPQPDATSDLAAFLLARERLLDREKFALAELLQRGAVDAVAWRVARLIARVDLSRGRDTVALETLRLLDAPANLGALAERLLDEDVLPGPYVERLLQRSGRACARALWSARISRNGTSIDGRESSRAESMNKRRERFVSWMIAIGPSARDVLRASLTKLAPHAASRRHAELIEDVLLALPTRCDDDLLSVVAIFAKSSPIVRVRELAGAAIERVLA